MKTVHSKSVIFQILFVNGKFTLFFLNSCFSVYKAFVSLFITNFGHMSNKNSSIVLLNQLMITYSELKNDM